MAEKPLSLQQQLAGAMGRLRVVDVERTLESGDAVTERRAADGSFQIVQREERADSEETNHSASLDSASDIPVSGVSKKRAKKVARLRRAGYVVDLKPDLQCARVREGLYIGSQDVAADLSVLEANGITHIVNCASGIANYFEGRMKYCRLTLLDDPTENIRRKFDNVHAFIANALENGGRVLVHCNAGISRASAIVISFLMGYDKLWFKAAYEMTIDARPVIKPNEGFYAQLKEYELELRHLKE